MPASPVRGTGAATLRATSHMVNPCFEGLSSRRLHVVAGVVLRGPTLANRTVYPLGCFDIMMSCDSLHPLLHRVPRGQRAPLDEFRALLIDQSAELVESFLPSRSTGPGVAPAKRQSSAHAADSSRDSCRSSLRLTHFVISSRSSRRGCDFSSSTPPSLPCQLISIFTVEAHHALLASFIVSSHNSLISSFLS